MPEDDRLKKMKYELAKMHYRNFHNSPRLKEQFNSPDDFKDFVENLYETAKKENERIMGLTARFYDPHQGFAGAIEPLPKSLKDIAHSLDGKVMKIEDALNQIALVSKPLNGLVLIDPEDNIIEISLGKEFIHHYRLIRYEEVQPLSSSNRPL